MGLTPRGTNPNFDHSIIPTVTRMSAFKYHRLDKNNVAVLLVDH